jgi:alkylhydroperoxidase family enzyme
LLTLELLLPLGQIEQVVRLRPDETVKGMTDAMFGELMSIVGVANMNNRLANGFQVPLDEKFK